MHVCQQDLHPAIDGAMSTVRCMAWHSGSSIMGDLAWSQQLFCAPMDPGVALFERVDHPSTALLTAASGFFSCLADHGPQDKGRGDSRPSSTLHALRLCINIAGEMTIRPIPS